MPDSLQEPTMPSTGMKVADSIQNVANATEKVAESGTMGIKGTVVQTIANLSAMALLGLVMWVQFRDNAAQSKEDRVMFREAVKTINDGAEKRSDRAEATHGKVFERMIASNEKQASAMESSNIAMTRASEEMKDLSKEVKALVKTVGSKGPNP